MFGRKVAKALVRSTNALINEGLAALEDGMYETARYKLAQARILATDTETVRDLDVVIASIPRY